MVAWLLKCNMSRLFMNFNTILKKMWNAYFLCSKQTFYIIRMPISYSSYGSPLFSSMHHYIIFLWLQRSIGQPKVIFFTISKIHNKKTDNQKKKFMTPVIPT